MMKQNSLSSKLNHEFPMAPAYSAFEATADGGARFTNPMEYREDITYFKVLENPQGFRVVERDAPLFAKQFNDLESLYNHIEKLSRLQRRMTPKQKLESQLSWLLWQNAEVLKEIEELKREIAFYED